MAEKKYTRVSREKNTQGNKGVGILWEALEPIKFILTTTNSNF